MSHHPWEYKLLVEYVNPVQPGQVPHFSHLQDQENLTEMLEDIVAHVPESVPDGWEVVSHDIAAFRNTIIVTFLLRRPA